MTIRPATVSDAQAICDLINYYAERGRMLHRSLESVYQSLRDFLVMEDRDEIVACVATELFWADLAEVRSLAVAPHARGKGLGTKLIRKAVAVAQKLGVHRLFALTYEKEFFARLGFEVIDRDKLPEKVWRACIYCPKADDCDETAMILRILSRSGKKPLPLQRKPKRTRKRTKVPRTRKKK
ncbi:MAG: N-acetyltransferase [Phycisphaerae bacterium]|nr:N-acetyltransferase [Phycisphaerae bacterium]